MIWKYDSEQVKYVKNYKLMYILIASITIIPLISIGLGYYLGIRNVEEPKYFIDKLYDGDGYLSIGGNHWVDSIFIDYECRANIYLNRVDLNGDKLFKDTPIKPSMLSLAARNAFDSTGVILPVELALAQAQIESNMGRVGKSPKNNPFNVGEYDNGTVKWFDNTADGIQAYYYLMCRKYLKYKPLDSLFKQFSDTKGYRYASNPNYEKELSKQYHFIKKYINEQRAINQVN